MTIEYKALGSQMFPMHVHMQLSSWTGFLPLYCIFDSVLSVLFFFFFHIVVFSSSSVHVNVCMCFAHVQGLNMKMT